jgi:ElaB/YqjD/DUF883 family membrane-anchored ribosome-binding protein
MSSAVAESPRAERPGPFRPRAADAARVAAGLTHDAWLLKSLAADAVDDGVHAAKRTYRIAARRFEDVTDEAATCIRRQPFKAVGVALGAGLLFGAAGAWLVRTFAAPRGRRI